jgi:hypothetical protein
MNDEQWTMDKRRTKKYLGAMRNRVDPVECGFESEITNGMNES